MPAAAWPGMVQRYSYVPFLLNTNASVARCPRATGLVPLPLQLFAFPPLGLAQTLKLCESVPLRALVRQKGAKIGKMGRSRRAAEAELAGAAAFRTELRRFVRRTETVAAEAGLTSQRYDLLLMISWAGGENGVRVTDLCELLQMQQTAVTELVKRAADAKLVERRVAPDDRRATLLRLTAEGERRLLRAFTALRGDREALAAALSELDVRLR